MLKEVYCRLQFVGFHFWEKATHKVAYLKHPHRHVFHVKAAKAIRYLDREIEFIQMKEQIQAYVDATYAGKTFEKSCEQIAEDLMSMFDLSSCDVSEDNENGCLLINGRKLKESEQ